MCLQEKTGKGENAKIHKYATTETKAIFNKGRIV